MFVAPLFEYSLPLYFPEEAEKKNWNESSELIDDIVGYNLKDRSTLIQYISEKNGNIEKMIKDTHELRP